MQDVFRTIYLEMRRGEHIHIRSSIECLINDGLITKRQGDCAVKIIRNKAMSDTLLNKIMLFDERRLVKGGKNNNMFYNKSLEDKLRYLEYLITRSKY